MKSILSKSLLVGAAGLLAATFAFATGVGPVFVIALENRNFTQPSNETYGPVVFGNSTAAPYINSLITSGNPNAQYVSWASSYHHDFAQPTGNTGGTVTLSGGVANGVGTTSVHPSEPNYLFFEAGTNFGVLDDNDPYSTGNKLSLTGTATGTRLQQINAYVTANPSVSPQHLTGLLQANAISWYSYQEGVDLQNSTGGNGNLGGNLTATPLAQSSWTVPLASFSGTNASYTNPYNGKDQWNFAVKHNGSLFFTDTNGSTLSTANTSTSNAFASNYRPLAQLATDLTNNNVPDFVFITPDQYNDMHTALSGGFSYNGNSLTGGNEQVAQGDNFLAQVVPLIMASNAFQNENATIIIWTDETESSLTGNNNNNLANDFGHTLTEIVISKLAKGNAYQSTLNYTHSSDLNTLQKIFQVSANTASGFLNDAANPSNGSQSYTGTGYGTGSAYDLSDLFQSGVIPTSIPASTSHLVDVTEGGLVANRRTGLTTQVVTVTNNTGSAISGNVYLAIDSLSSNTSAHNVVGLTASYSPTNSPYVLVSGSGLAAGASQQVTLTFTTPTTGSINYTPRVVVPQGGTTDNGNP